MALQDRATLKTFYETFDKPTQGQFADWLDSVPNIVDDYNSAPVFVQRAKIDIPAAAVRTLNSSPVTIVPAPGANKAVEVVSASVQLFFTAPVYATNPALDLTHTGANFAQVFAPSVLNATGSIFRRFSYPTFFIADLIQVVTNQALILKTSADIVTGGSAIRVYCAFRILDTS